MSASSTRRSPRSMSSVGSRRTSSQQDLGLSVLERVPERLLEGARSVVTRAVARMVPEGERAAGRMSGQIGPEPALLLRPDAAVDSVGGVSGSRAVRVQRNQVPGADVEAVPALPARSRGAIRHADPVEIVEVPFPELSWSPRMGRLIDFTRPHVGSYTASMFASEALLYWMSPSGSTAASPAPTSRSDVWPWWQNSPVPWSGLTGSQAISPAAAMSGSCAAAPALNAIESPTAARITVNSHLLRCGRATGIALAQGQSGTGGRQPHPPRRVQIFRAGVSCSEGQGSGRERRSDGSATPQAPSPKIAFARSDLG